MATIRVEKNKDNPYVMLNKYGINDNNLSWKAKGILLYLLSKPDDWKCQVNDLIKHAKDGRDSTYAGLKELRANGYMIKRPIRDGKGKVKEWEEVIYEIPNEEAKKVYESQIKTKPVDNVENEGNSPQEPPNDPLTGNQDVDGSPLTDIPEVGENEEKPLTDKPDMEEQDPDEPKTDKPDNTNIDLPITDSPINEGVNKDYSPEDLLNYLNDILINPINKNELAYIKDYWLSKLTPGDIMNILITNKILKVSFNELENVLIKEYVKYKGDSK